MGAHPSPDLLASSLDDPSQGERGNVQIQRVAVLGLGYVGLPLVRACVSNGHEVIGFDVSARVTDNLARGISHVDDVSDSEVKDWLTQGFLPTADVSMLSEIDVFVICVPTPLSSDGTPDLSAVESAARLIAGQLHSGRRPLVVLESTTYPGTTEEIVKPILESGGLLAAQDFSLAFSPERIDPGNTTWTFENTPKLVGGYTSQCADRAEEFYSSLTTKVVRTKGLKEAEMAKLLENTYRHVNIALVNELAKVSHLLGIDFWDVIAAAETKPHGFQAFRPGPGVGGHCIPIDPNYLGHRVRAELGQSLRFVELAQEINASMPEYVAHRVVELFTKAGSSVSGSKVLLLGITYKPDIADVRESPAFGVARSLRELGAHVSYHDEHIAQWDVDGEPVARIASLAQSREFDCTVLLQSHAQYLESLDQISSALMLDTQGRVARIAGAHIPAWSTL